jgi:hypothetical protein
MNDQTLGRREFIKGAVVGGAAAATAATPHLSESAKAEQTGTMPAAEGYTFFNLAEAAFVEALVDHMVPADELSPKGTDIGINVYIDRALAGAWGKGERLYMQGPWKLGAPSQGYQLPLTPAQLCRAGIEATNARTCSLPCPPASSSSTMVYRRASFGPQSIRLSWKECSRTRSTEATATRRDGVFLASPAPSRSIARMSRGSATRNSPTILSASPI